MTAYKLPKTPVIDSKTFVSPNYNSRPSGTVIDSMVIHTTEGYWESDAAWLCDPDSGVSTGYVVNPAGKIYRLVPDAKRAWHAGDSEYAGRSDYNDFSIGIEISHKKGQAPYTAAQLRGLTELCRYLISIHPMKREYTVTHRTIAIPAGRKSDPTDWTEESFNRFADALYQPYDPLTVATIAGPAGILYSCGTGMYKYYNAETRDGMFELGFALTDEYRTNDSLNNKVTIMRFERAVLKYMDGVGVQPALLSEVISMGWSV